MSLLTHIVLAQASHGGLLLEHPPERGWPHLDLRGLTDQHLLALFAVLLPPGAARAMDDTEVGFAHIPASEPTAPVGPWVMLLPDALTALLADLDPAAIAQAVARWRKSALPPPPELWPVDALHTLLTELQPMAQLVQASRGTDPLQLFLRVDIPDQKPVSGHRC